MMSIKKEISCYMEKQLNSLLKNQENGFTRARLANLRRGIGKVPGELPELWGEFLDGMPESLLGEKGIPSYAQWAIYLSLTMFALHQQGKHEPMHVTSISLGSAAAKLMEDFSDEERKRVLRRFGPVITAKDMPEFAHHLRSLIQLFSAKNIALDYVQLAEDIYDFQFPNGRKRVQLRWGQDFYL